MSLHHILEAFFGTKRASGPNGG